MADVSPSTSRKAHPACPEMDHDVDRRTRRGADFACGVFDVPARKADALGSVERAMRAEVFVAVSDIYLRARAWDPSPRDYQRVHHHCGATGELAAQVWHQDAEAETNVFGGAIAGLARLEVRSYTTLHIYRAAPDMFCW